MTLTLLCFPFAGGSSSAVFRGWQAELGPGVEVLPVPLPGRETRFAELPVPDLVELAELLTDELEESLEDRHVLFGHSMGALLAFEVAREVRKRGGRPPECLVVSGKRAPQLPDRRRLLHDLPDEEFIEELRDYGGTPEQVLAEPELMALLLPMLRADFTASETYQLADEPPLDVPLVAIGGTEDERVNRDELLAWRTHTRGSFRPVFLPGGHFFLHSQRALLFDTLRDVLAAYR